jgi:hypothetical protein
VFTDITSSDVVLDRLSVIGGRRGVAMWRTTRHLTLRTSMIQQAKVAGVAVGGSDITLQDVTVKDSGTGVRVERGAQDVTAVGLRVSGGQDGVVATPGTTRLTLSGLTARGIGNDAVRSFSPDTRIVGGTIVGATTGLNIAAPATISGTTISLVSNGIRTRSPGQVTADDVTVEAVAVGVDTGPTSPFLLVDSHVHALDAVRGKLSEHGTNDLSLPPLNRVGAIGLPLVLVALVLQLVQLARQRCTDESTHHRWTPPRPRPHPVRHPPPVTRDVPQRRARSATPSCSSPRSATARDRGCTEVDTA